MALDLVRMLEGIQIEDASGASNSITAGAHVSILQGTGVPGGDGGQQDAAGIGSLYMQRDAAANNLQLYYKWSLAGSSAADWKTVTSKEYVDALVQGLSWREPAKVLDATVYANLAAAVTAANVADTVNGVTIVSGDRLLFTNLTSGNKNVYIVSGSTGAWVFTEDTNLATDGDALMVQQGTSADIQWVFDGTAWVQISSGGNAELAFIRSFIGKTIAGAQVPQFTSTNLLIVNDNLTAAASKLDAGLGDGNIVNTGSTYVLSSDLAFSGTSGAAGALTVTQALDELNAGIGNRTYTNSGVILTSGQTVTASLEALNVATTNIVNQTTVITGSVTSTPGTLVAVDTIPLALADQIKWMVEMRDNVSTSLRRGFEVYAMTDGTTVDTAQTNILKIGAGVTGVGFAVVINGTNLELKLKATNNYDYVVHRIAYSHF